MATLVALVVILFLFRPGVYRLRHRIAGSIGSALGRRVEIDNVRLRALPNPGFDLEGLVIYDDPAFSEEPMVRAQDVAATIRLRSLLRGRLEIARLSATEPSINLVRNHEGRWNLTALLERNARIPVAPTGKASSERRPAFPYLEAVHARINLKIEQEKKAYALTDADVGLWQESENSWGARMRAQPVRTDFNLTDTGLVVMSATWQRAENLRATPLQVSVEWQKGQLGQISTLFTGRDRGWRGGVSFSANLSGTPDALQIESQTTVTDFHRYDIAASENVRLAASCAGRYSVASGTLADLQCDSPLASGTLKLAGTLRPVGEGLNYDLTLAADKVPLTSALRVLRQAKKQLPTDLTATGLVKAKIHAVRDGEGPADIDGEGLATNVRLLTGGGKNEVVIGNVPLTFVSAPVATGAPADNEEILQPQLRIGTLPVAVGGATPATAGGWISPTGYRFMLTGDFALKNLFQLADGIGLGGSRPAVDGLARGALNVSGAWQGFAAATVVGRAQLRSVRAEIRGVNTPVEIASASVTLTPDFVAVEKLSAQTGTTHWAGSVSATRHCAAPDCTLRFDLSADRLSTAEFYEWFATQSPKRPWYRLLNLGERTGPSPLLEKRASGTLRVGKLELKKLIASQVTAQLDLDQGKITLNDVRAQLLQGTHQGNWTIDATSHPVKYQATGTLQNIALAQVGTLMNDSWVTGTADGKFEGTASGLSLADLMASAAVTVHFSVKNGSLPHVDNPGSTGPLSVHKLNGDLQVDKGTWQLSATRLESRDGIFQVSGRFSADSGLNFTLQRSDEQSWTLFGPLAKPRLERTSHTEAKAVVPAKQ
jgi:AsmA protein